MSDLFIHPLLLAQGYSSMQIQRILQSFALYPNFYIPKRPMERQIPVAQVSQRTYRSKNLIIQQSCGGNFNTNILTTSSDNSVDNSNEANDRDQSLKRQYIEEAQQLQPQNAYQNSLTKQASNKNKKISNQKRLKKMTLRQKRMRQFTRNQTQNSKRNIIPNEIHQMLSILFKKNKSSHLVQKLIKNLPDKNSSSSTKYSTQRFYLYQSILKSKINHYANQSSLKALFEYLEPQFYIYTKEQQQMYGKIGIILVSHFIRKQSTLIILNSQRIKSENKLDHLKTKRYLSQVFSQLVMNNSH